MLSTFNATFLSLAEQNIYYEESGLANGYPVLYLHGGPGSGMGSGGKQLIEEGFHLVSFDQRGCGKSTPNVLEPGYDFSRQTTSHIIADIEALRKHLSIQKWLVMGISWGSALALAYAREHPDVISGLTLAAVTSGSRQEIDWISEGVGAIFPEAWDKLARFAESAGIGFQRGRTRLIEAYAQLLRSENPSIREAAAEAWTEWEDTHISIAAGGVKHDPRWDDADFRLSFATLVTHYWANDCFISPPILEKMPELFGKPVVFIHGRNDISSPALTAWMMHQKLPGSKLLIIEDEGHVGGELKAVWGKEVNKILHKLNA